jgi:RNA polymerase sigma-70 factor (sigma-E family)
MSIGGRWPGSSREEELLSRLYQQVTELQAARFGAACDIAAGLDRYRSWLGEHTTEDEVRLGAIQSSRPMALQTSPSSTTAGPPVPGTGEAAIGGGTTAKPSGPPGDFPAARAAQDADRAVTALYSAHYRSLVRLAVLLVRDMAAAEELVQDAFVATHSAWRKLADSDQALCYLRQSVVNRCRSLLRHRLVVDKITPKLAPDMAGSEHEAIIQFERSAVLAALQALPARQREVLVLRYYADLSEAQIASAMGISKGAVKSHTARAISSLRTKLRQVDD